MLIFKMMKYSLLFFENMCCHLLVALSLYVLKFYKNIMLSKLIPISIDVEKPID